MNKIKLIDVVNKIINNPKKADALIRIGDVFVNNQVETLPSKTIKDSDHVTITPEKFFVSRGALKLKHAIEHWKLDFNNKTIVDIGSSTGGFTQISLLNGAKKVYCVDSGTNQLDYSLRMDPRTVVLENTNLKNVNQEIIPDAIDWIVCDVSFISLKEVFKSVLNLNLNKTQLILLIKPQFEARRDLVENKGIVDIKHHKSIIDNVINYDKENFELVDYIESPITGKKSKNLEYLSYFKIKEK